MPVSRLCIAAKSNWSCIFFICVFYIYLCVCVLPRQTVCLSVSLSSCARVCVLCECIFHPSSVSKRGHSSAPGSQFCAQLPLSRIPSSYCSLLSSSSSSCCCCWVFNPPDSVLKRVSKWVAHSCMVLWALLPLLRLAVAIVAHYPWLRCVRVFAVSYDINTRFSIGPYSHSHTHTHTH